MSVSLSNFTGTLVLVGAGKMGGAMLEGWFALGLDPRKVAILEPKPAPEIAVLKDRGVRVNPPIDAIADTAVIILAVKPQVAAEVAPPLKALMRPDTVAVSVMAGKTIAFLEGALGNIAIVRSIPNTPAAIGRGITVAVPNAKVTTAQRTLADVLLSSVGAVEWVDDEGLMDAVTAVSGSGPAYIFHFIEALTIAAEKAGLPAETAKLLAMQTVFGAASLAAESDDEPGELRRQVTSPNGTTAAALAVLMGEDRLTKLVTEAVEAARLRSIELGK